jgi:hypothetical protein
MGLVKKNGAPVTWGPVSDGGWWTYSDGFWIPSGGKRKLEVPDCTSNLAKVFTIVKKPESP